MPSMKCHECKKIAKCSTVAAVDEHDRTTLVYLCAPCKREWLADQASADNGLGENG